MKHLAIKRLAIKRLAIKRLAIKRLAIKRLDQFLTMSSTNTIGKLSVLLPHLSAYM